MNENLAAFAARLLLSRLNEPDVYSVHRGLGQVNVDPSGPWDPSRRRSRVRAPYPPNRRQARDGAGRRRLRDRSKLTYRKDVTDISTKTSTISGGGPSRGLDRELIVQEALRLIDRDGAQGLSMRSLAQELGVVPMALYRHVSGREDLLEAVVSSLLDGVREDLDVELAKTWQGYLQSLAHAVRRIAVDHAAAFPLVATRHPATPWLRPPLRSLDLVEDFLQRLGEHGFNDDQIAHAYRGFSSFLLGHLLLEAATRGAETSPVEVPFDEGDAQIPNADGEIDLANRPATKRLRAKLSEDHSEDEFEISLETLLDRLEMTLTQ